MKKLILFFTIILCMPYIGSAQFTYSGYIKNADGTAAVNVPVKLYQRTTPTLTGFTSQTNYNGHSYYRSTSSSTWTNAKAACEAMGGHLATISNTAENSFLFNTWPSGWIGYYQDKVAGYTYSEPLGGYRWTENQVINGLQADYDVSSYSTGSTLSDIKNSINATLYNSPAYSSTGGKYLTFNGSNTYAITGNLSSKMGSTSAITLFTWIYPTGNGVIIDELGVGNTSSGWHATAMEIVGGNTIRVGFWNGSAVSYVSSAITLNAWHLVAVTYDGTTLKGYLDNTNFGSTTFSRQTPQSVGNGEYFALGLADATNMGSGAYGAFRLGDFQVFNRALTADELDRTYNLYAYRYKLNQYVYWNGGEPNNSGTEDYAQFVSNGMWNDLPNTSLPYVIEFDYIMDFTAWALYRTVYTDATGKYTINETTNPSIEWYIKLDAPTPVSPLQITDLIGVSDVLLLKTAKKSIHWNMYDVNGDGLISISDAYFINMKRTGLKLTWTSMPASAIYTSSQYATLTLGTADLRSSVIGASSITINSPVSGTTTGNYYLIAPGYKSQVTY